MSSALKELASAIDDECVDIEVVNRKCGLASLPDDLLAMIFDYVVNEEESKDRVPMRWMAAVELSHVCRHFRDVSLSCPRLWTTINRSSKMAVACLPRARSVPLIVNITVCPDENTGGWSFDPFINHILPCAKRWGQLIVVYDFLTRDDLDLNKATYQKLRQLDAPLLEELQIANDSWDISGTCDWDWSQWNTPKLRRVEAVFCFPSHLPGLASVISLELTLHADHVSISGILAEISRMDHLLDFTFTLLSSEMDVEPIEVPVKMIFSSVQRLHITTELHFPEENPNPAIKSALFSSLFFPSVVKLHLKLLDYDHDKYLHDPGWEDSDALINSYFNNEIARIFRHVEQFPRVSEFHLRVHPALSSYRGSVGGVIYLSVPLDMLPGLKHFTLVSDTGLEMSQPNELDEVNFEDGVPPPRVVGDVLPVLDTIVLDLPQAGGIADWVCDYLQGLRDQERVGFRELIVMEGNASSGRRKASFLGDDALEWTRRHLEALTQ